MMLANDLSFESLCDSSKGLAFAALLILASGQATNLLLESLLNI
jgi:hypothetical protein